MSAGAIGLMTGDVTIACSQGDAHRVGRKHETPYSLAADFLFVAGKHWKVLVLLLDSCWHGFHGSLWRTKNVTCSQLHLFSMRLVLEGCQ